MNSDTNEMDKELNFFDALSDRARELYSEELQELKQEKKMQEFKEEKKRRAVLVTGEVGYIGAGAVLHNMLRQKLEDVELIEPQRGIDITEQSLRKSKNHSFSVPLFPVTEVPKLTDTSAYTDMPYEFRNFYNPKESMGFRPSKHGCERLQPKNKRRKRKIAKLSRKKNRK